MKTLVAGTIYCKFGDKERTRVVLEFLDLMGSWSEKYPEAVFLVVNNDTQQPEILEKLAKLESSNFKVQTFSPQRYWSGARNFVVRTALKLGYELVVFMDDDITPPDDWLPRVWAVHKAHPEIKTGVVEDAVTLPDVIGKVPYDDLEVVLYREYLGCFNVVTREVLATVGGFREGDNFKFGFCDTEYGVRLAKAGFFNYSLGQYANPYGFNIKIRGKSSPGKSSWVSENAPYYYAVRDAILLGILPVYVDPSTGYPAWTVERKDDVYV